MKRRYISSLAQKRRENVIKTRLMSAEKRRLNHTKIGIYGVVVTTILSSAASAGAAIASVPDVLSGTAVTYITISAALFGGFAAFILTNEIGTEDENN